MDRPLIIVDPQPRTLDQICDGPTRARLEALGHLEISEPDQMDSRRLDDLLADAEILIGQTAMPAERLERAVRLRAIFNVETNFLPNIDYRMCQARGIWVLSPTAAFAQVVAEAGLAMAIDLVRGISAADRAFRAGREQYGLAANDGCFMFSGAPVGMIGFGDLGRALRPLLAPFRTPVSVHDPWLPDELIRAHDCVPASLDEVFSGSRVVLIVASPTSENQGAIGKRVFELMQPGSAVVLLSRAAVVDFPEFVRQVRSGRILGATDVFPDEPVAADDPVRQVEGMLLSAHRTGGMQEALYEIGRRTVADAELILRGLPPQLCRRADASLAERLRSKPVSVT